MRGALSCGLQVGPEVEREVEIEREIGPEVEVEVEAERERWRAQAIAAARAAWPGVAVSDRDFLHHLAVAAQRDAARSVDDRLAGDAASELYLACSCALGDPAALRAFEAHYLAGLDAVLRRLALSLALIDEVKQDVRQRLLVGEPAHPPRIAEFTGAGSLRGWLAIVALNAARQLLRRAEPARAAERASDTLLDAVPHSTDDAELALLKRHYREQFRAAFAVALGELSPRERTLLRQRYLHGTGIGELARIYRVHRGTATRWLERCNRRLLSATRRLLASRLRVDRAEIDSILRMIGSRLDISIRTSLAAEA